MAAPTPSIFVSGNGRRGEITCKVNWSSDDSTNLSDYKLFDLATDLSGDYSGNARIAIESIEWTSSPGVGADIYYDAMPPSADSNIHTISLGATQGEEDFGKHPNGNRPDPGTSPSNVRITTQSAADGDDLYISMRYVEKGTRANQ